MPSLFNLFSRNFSQEAFQTLTRPHPHAPTNSTISDDCYNMKNIILGTFVGAMALFTAVMVVMMIVKDRQRRQEAERNANDMLVAPLAYQRR